LGKFDLSDCHEKNRPPSLAASDLRCVCCGPSTIGAYRGAQYWTLSEVLSR
jgi:hypothetical protein